MERYKGFNSILIMYVKKSNLLSQKIERKRLGIQLGLRVEDARSDYPNECAIQENPNDEEEDENVYQFILLLSYIQTFDFPVLLNSLTGKSRL